ncbi:MAG: 4Fe-4S dicluster domain-containing protein [Lachnospiraceae bacterium]|nr:4Fe-4S dicluster domain-containing protein [Lachnospiraceae bacterium]
MSYLGEEIRNLGFGLMRLPRKDEKIDIEQVKEMVDLFMDAGFTYFDTAWAYEGSEDAIRQALIERYPRESFQLATKNAAWITADSRENAVAQLETSLKRTCAGYFDFYLLHNLGQKRTKVFDDFDMWNFVQEKKAEGLIRHIGFSFHSTAEELEEILNAHPEAEFVQLQINYADWESNAIQSRKNYEVCRKYNKPVIIMEPVKGGLLATPPEPVRTVFDAAAPNASYASWAIRFAADLDGLVTVLSGMSNVEQMKDNLSFMRDFHKLSAAEKETITQAQEALSKIPLIPCTSCDYCAKVCPNDIGISVSFSAMNNYTLYGNKASGLNDMLWNIDRQGKKRAHECIKCGACEDACPQHIAIRDELDKVAEVFAQ